jgi:hypothetical protein
VETAANILLLHIREDVGQGQERVFFDYYKCGEERADEHAEHVLAGVERSSCGIDRAALIQ